MFDNIVYITFQTKGLEWEQELYNQFKYIAQRPHFHTFAADVSKS